MKRRSEQTPDWDAARDEIIGLGSRSLRKSYFGALRQRLAELERFRALLDQATDAIVVTELPSLRVVDANRAGRALLATAEARGDPLVLSSFFAPAEWKKIEHALRTGDETAQTPATVVTMRRPRRRELELSTCRDVFGDARYFVLVARDVTERRRAERALRIAKAGAERAARARAEFLSIASHELRTPLTSLQLTVEHALRRDAGGGLGAGALERVLRQVGRLTMLVNELLDVSRLEHGRIVLHLEEVDLRTTVGELFEEFRGRAGGRPLSLVISQQPLTVMADPVRIAQVLSNLLDNAIKYSPEASPIEVRAWSDEAVAHVSVADRGPGIPAKDRARLFAPFARLGGAKSTVPGLGLGLYISQQIARLHGGELRAGAADDGGSTFVLTLPAGVSRERSPRAPVRGTRG